MNLAIIAAQFNSKVMDSMVAFAQMEAKSAGVEVVCVTRVPGCYELPLPLSVVLAKADVQAAVVLGCIERGHTLHGEVMGHVVCRSVIDLSLQNRKPVGLGIIGPGATQEQIEQRAEPHARAAVKAAVASFQAMKAIPKP